MSRTLHILLIFFLLLVSCSSDESVPSPQNDWTPDVSRSVTGGQELRVVGRKGGVHQFDAILIPASDGGKATWKDNVKPDADKVSASDEFIAFAPAGKGLPSSVMHDGVTEYWVDYKSSKPQSFDMHPMMAQLNIHVWVEETSVHTLENDSIQLYTKADVDYPLMSFKNLATYDHVCLGEFSQTMTMDQSDTHFDRFSMKKPLIVLPQTIPKGKDVLWFSIEKLHYFFRPQEDIVLKPGFITTLTLHVAYQEEELEEAKKHYIWIDNEGITVTPWETGETVNGGEAVEQ